MANLNARRLDALWKIASNLSLGDADASRALLTLAAATIRPGTPFAAHLHRVDGATLVLEEAIAHTPGAGESAVYPMARQSERLENTPLFEVVRSGATHSCADLAAVPELAHREAVRVGGMRAFIGTAFRAGDAIFTITLGSSTANACDFDVEDSHFIESVATLLEKRVGGRLQRARMLARASADADAHARHAATLAALAN